MAHFSGLCAPRLVAMGACIEYLASMIPRLSPDEHLPAIYASFLKELADSDFSGEIHTDYATRLVTATDNSVYQIIPLAVLYPKNEDDLALVLGLSHRQHYRSVKLSPRGGGTGTNGQSLCDGVIVDVSRHFREIISTNIEEGWVRVQPGVVLDQLNAHLAPHGVFFAPNLSPSSRATLGGMINTDASGKGSRIYGKTSDHVLSLRSVLIDGTILNTERIGADRLQEICSEEGAVANIYREIRDVVESSREKIKKDIPQLKRFLTGYDLAHIEQEDGSFDLSRVITGSEGTLAIVTEAKLRLTPIPRQRKLVAIRYSQFDSALRAASELVSTNPSAIETVDDTIVGLARKDVIWHSISHLVEAENETPAAAINLVEFESDDPVVVDDKVERLVSQLRDECGQKGKATGFVVATERCDIDALWTLRKKGVGLLGNAAGPRRPVPFVEDTAVPPEHLADYIQEFRALLDKRGLRYGMFGHVDVGCLHVRPALDLKDPDDEAALSGITEEVVALVKKYGGVLWGEHGRGYRSEYTPTFFGEELYKELRRVKAVFDPHNQLNPGKLATPTKSDEKLVRVDAMKRGAFDRQISDSLQASYEKALACNGNGACFDWNPDAVMCPSSKVTNQRIHSPKGRAGILREWLRLLSREGHEAETSQQLEQASELKVPKTDPQDDFSHQVYEAMSGCLACKACATQCPVKVDIPAMKSDFLEQYHSRYRRPLKDYFVASLEGMLKVLVLWPRMVNWLMELSVFKWALSRFVGIVDSPLLAVETLKAGLAKRKAETFEFSRYENLNEKERSNMVFIAQDAFTTYYEPKVALAAYDLLTHLGKRVIFLPFRQNGKALHVKGFLSGFRQIAGDNATFYSKVSTLKIPVVGIEPAVTLTYRDEYLHELGDDKVRFKVLLLQEYLAQQRHSFSPANTSSTRSPYRLFGHCTERTFEPQSQKLWVDVFESLGVPLQTQALGCCGMCGAFGHEKDHYDESRGVFELSWKKALAQKNGQPTDALATGHSCRSQVKRFEGFVPRHPVEALLQHLQS